MPFSSLFNRKNNQPKKTKSEVQIPGNSSIEKAVSEKVCVEFASASQVPVQNQNKLAENIFEPSVRTEDGQNNQLLHQNVPRADEKAADVKSLVLQDNGSQCSGDAAEIPKGSEASSSSNGVPSENGIAGLVETVSSGAIEDCTDEKVFSLETTQATILNNTTAMQVGISDSVVTAKELFSAVEECKNDEQTGKSVSTETVPEGFSTLKDCKNVEQVGKSGSTKVEPEVLLPIKEYESVEQLEKLGFRETVSEEISIIKDCKNVEQDDKSGYTTVEPEVPSTIKEYKSVDQADKSGSTEAAPEIPSTMKEYKSMDQADKFGSIETAPEPSSTIENCHRITKSNRSNSVVSSSELVDADTTIPVGQVLPFRRTVSYLYERYPSRDEHKTSEHSFDLETLATTKASTNELTHEKHHEHSMCLNSHGNYNLISEYCDAMISGFLSSIIDNEGLGQCDEDINSVDENIICETRIKKEQDNPIVQPNDCGSTERTINVGIEEHDANVEAEHGEITTDKIMTQCDEDANISCESSSQKEQDIAVVHPSGSTKRTINVGAEEHDANVEAEGGEVTTDENMTLLRFEDSNDSKDSPEVCTDSDVIQQVTTPLESSMESLLSEGEGESGELAESPTQQKQSWKVGYLQVKQPAKSRGRGKLKVWRQRWVVIQLDEFVKDTNDPSLLLNIYASESGNARRHNALFWCVVSARNTVVHRSQSRTHKYAFSISVDGDVILHLTANSETASQEWMWAIRNLLWPPSPVLLLEKVLHGSQFEVSVIDNDFSFHAGLLGCYGNMKITSNKLILSHPQTDHVVQEWYLNTLDKFQLLPQHKEEDALKVVAMVTGEDSSTGRGQIILYCPEAVSMLQSIASTIHKLLQFRTTQGKDNNKEELAALVQWLPPIISSSTELPEDYYKVPRRQIRSLLDIPNFVFEKPLSSDSQLHVHEATPISRPPFLTSSASASTFSQDSGISMATQPDDFLNCSLTSFTIGGCSVKNQNGSDSSDGYSPPCSPEVVRRMSDALGS